MIAKSTLRIYACGFGCWAALVSLPRMASALTGHPATEVEFINNGYADGVNRAIGFEILISFLPRIVGELGVFDFGRNGLVHAHEVGIWTLDGTLLVSGVVPAETAAELSGDFRYVDVADTPLPFGSYIVGATWPAAGDEFVWDQEVDSAPGYAVGGYSNLIFFAGDGSARFNDDSAAFAFPTKTVGAEFPGDRRRVFWGPNFTVVPEPSSQVQSAVITSAIAVAALNATRRERRRALHELVAG